MCSISPRLTYLFEIGAGVISQTEVQAFPGRRLLDYIGMAFELVADRCPNKIGAIGIKTVLHHEVDVSQIDVTEIDGDFLGFREP